MAFTWLALKDRILRLLDDVDRESPTWSDEDLLDYVNEALINLGQHTAQESSYTYELSESTSSVDLPDDLLEIGPVWLITGTAEYLMTPIKIEPGQDFSTLNTSGLRMYYYQYPSDTLNFTGPISAGYDVKVDYWGYFEEVEEDDDTINGPRWMMEALKWACVERAMSKPAASAASLRQWNTKRDSGDPEDNSPLAFAEYCHKQYMRALTEHSAQDRSGWGSQ